MHLERLSWRTVSIGIALVVSIQAALLYIFGQSTICACGYVKLWEGVVLSSGNSQHITDWYTFSHIIHGMLLYGLFTYLFPKARWYQKLLAGMMIESAWEILENTPVVIEHYRQQALAQGYIGDSILNSVSDTVAMMFGFMLAWRLPVWGVVIAVLVLEGGAAYAIRDNLTLNIMNLIHQTQVISDWQAAGHQ